MENSFSSIADDWSKQMAVNTMGDIKKGGRL